jgi:spore maturation protein SpmA
MKYLLVSADDFGLTKTINEGIVQAYKEGIVTCVNLMPTGEAFESALKLAKMTGLVEVAQRLGARIFVQEQHDGQRRARNYQIITSAFSRWRGRTE